MILSIKKHPVIQLVNAHLVDYPTPSNSFRGFCSIPDAIPGVPMCDYEPFPVSIRKRTIKRLN